MSEMASILMVDDILANRKIAGKILAGHFIVDTVKSGEEALDFFTKKIPDLVLLDIHMEGIDGFEVLRRMKDYPATAEIPVIFLTAFSTALAQAAQVISSTGMFSCLFFAGGDCVFIA